MERYKSIYLTGLFSILACAILLFLWTLLMSAPVGWLGIVITFLAILATLMGFYQAFKYYSDKSIPKLEQKARRKHFIGHAIVLSLAIVGSFQSFQYFRKTVLLPGQKGDMEITIKNTSSEVAKDLSLQVGGFNQKIKEIKPQGQVIIQANVPPGDSLLKIEMGSGDALRQATVNVGPENHLILIRIDPFQNLLPDVN